MIVTVDDLCLQHLKNFDLFDEMKVKIPSLQVMAFTISNFENKERLAVSTMFRTWYEKHKSWVVIGVHSYDHLIPDGDRDEENQISKALTELKPFLPKRYAYRSSGYQTTNETVPILKKLGFSYIYYQTQVKDLTSNKIIEKNIINSHLYDEASIRRIYEILCCHN